MTKKRKMRWRLVVSFRSSQKTAEEFKGRVDDLVNATVENKQLSDTNTHLRQDLLADEFETDLGQPISADNRAVTNGPSV